MKITVGPTSNLVFQPATDRGASAKIAIGSGGGGGGAATSIAYNQANAARGQANTAYAQANGAYSQANAAYNAANNAQVTVFANSASGVTTQNINFINTSTISVAVSSSGSNANVSFTSLGAGAYDQANAARDQANTAYGQANSSRTQANTARDQANTARDQANTAYGQANLKLDIAGGTITGNLVVSGNLEVLGNSTILNVETLFVEDNEIVLNSNTSGAPVLNAYITINRGTSPNANILWNEDTNQWQWNDGDANYFSFDTSLDAYAQANAAYDNANTRVLKAGDTMTGTLNVAASIISQNIIPNLNVTYDLGNTTNRFNDLYLGGNSVYIGDAILSTNGDTVLTNTFVAEISFISGGLNVLNQANSAYEQANTATTDAQNAYGQANNSRDQANTARDTANGAYSQANGAYGQANGAYAQANGAYAQANGAYDQANGAYSQANNAYAHANVVYAHANNAYDQANNSRNQANTARNTANDSYSQANTARDQANTARTTANDAYNTANTKVSKSGDTMTGDLTINTVLYANQANITTTLNVGTSIVTGGATGDISGANAVFAGSFFTNDGLNVAAVGVNSYSQANNARDQANTARDQANTARTQANTAYGQANDAYAQANTARGTANDAYAQANTARDTANSAYAQANTSIDAYGQANTARTTANDAYAQANTARNQANAAYDTANSKLSLTGGSLSGDLIIAGNLFVTGSNTLLNVSTLSVNDSLILLSNGATGDAFDIGFVGHFDRSGTPTHAGLIRKATENRFYLFDNYEVEPTNNIIDISGNNFRTGNLKLNTLNADSFVTTAGLNVTDQANTARDQANTARDQANTSRDQANTARTTANDAYGQANTARDQANTARDQANTARTQANTARTQANTAYAQANNKSEQPTVTYYVQAYAPGPGATYYFRFRYANGTGVNTDDGDLVSGYNDETGATSSADSPTLVFHPGTTVEFVLSDMDPDTGAGVQQFAIIDPDTTTGGPYDLVNDGIYHVATDGTITSGINANLKTSGRIFWTVPQKHSGKTNYTYGSPTTLDAVSGSIRIAAYGTQAYAQANTARNQANTARDQANTARTQANNSYAAANSAANTARVSANSGSTLSAKQLNFNNSGSILVTLESAGDGTNANISFTTIGASAADAYNQANSARDQANTARDTANGAYNQANSNYISAEVEYKVYAVNAGVSFYGYVFKTNDGKVISQWNYADGSAYLNPALYLRPGTTVAFKLMDDLDPGVGWNSQPFNIYDSDGTTLLTEALTHVATNGTVTTGSAAQGKTSGTLYFTIPPNRKNTAYYYKTSDFSGSSYFGGLFPVDYYAHQAETTAETVYYYANLAYDQANTARGQANTARTTANDAYGAANSAANTARVSANSGSTLSAKQLNFNNSGSILVTIESAGDGTNANISFVTAGASAADAYNQANSARDQANTARDTANGAYAHANIIYAQANTARDTANAAYAQANSNYISAEIEYEVYAGSPSSGAPTFTTYYGYQFKTNDGFNIVAWNYSDSPTVINPPLFLRPGTTVAFKLMNGLDPPDTYSTQPFNIYDYDGSTLLTEGLTHVSTDGTVTTGITAQNRSEGTLYFTIPQNRTNTVYYYKSGGGAGATLYQGQFTVDRYSNRVQAFAETVYDQANTARGQANTARGTANDAYAQANSARDQANTARTQANNAYAEANLKLNLTGGTINGSLNISGNLFVTGNTTFINTSTYTVDDPLIYLAANNTLTDIVDIGFIGAKNSGSSVTHTGLARDAGDGTWYLFDNLNDSGHENNVIDFANTTLATLHANIIANSITLYGNVVATHANLILAYDQANSARDQANTAYGQANNAYEKANAPLTIKEIYFSNNGIINTYSQINTIQFDYESGMHAINAASNTVTITLSSTFKNWYMNGSPALVASGLDTVNFIGEGISITANNIDTPYKTIKFTSAALDAYEQANSARNQANTARTTANDAYGQANSAYDKANSATVRITANTGSLVTTPNINFVNTSTISVSVVSGDSGNANVSFTSSGAQQYTYDTTTTSAETVDSWSASTYRSGKYQMQVENLFGFAALEIMLLHDGTTTNLIKYAETTIGGGVGTFSSDINGGLVRLRFTANDPTSQLTYYKSLLTSRVAVDSLPTDLMTGTIVYDLMTDFALSPSDLNA